MERNRTTEEKVRSVREQQNAFVAQELVNQGKQQLAENNTREAWRNFTQAAELDPTNTEARRMADEAGAMLGHSRFTVDDTFRKLRNENQVRMDQAKAEVFRRFSEGKVLYQRGEFDESIRAFEGVL